MIVFPTLRAALLGVFVTTASGYAQQPFSNKQQIGGPLLAQTSSLHPTTLAMNPTSSYDDGLFTPFEDLRQVTAEEFTVLSHPAFPSHSVRIKKSNFCDETVNAFTGYIDMQARHLFFYFFESRNDPAKDDVILWTNGGPGCSSSIGLFFELGPCSVQESNDTIFNPYSWNSNASIFFIDQPIGVGFSYAEYGEAVGTTEEAAKDVAAFVSIFFENFSQFKGRGFHMAGESYGGRYIPVFAAEVFDQNTRLVNAGLTPINLKSAIIGNGITDSYEMVLSYYDIQCTPASIAPFVDISACVRMKQALPRCSEMLKESCVNRFDAMGCFAAQQFCGSELEAPFQATGLNPYDISKPCKGGPNDLCYPEMNPIRQYLDRPDVRDVLGVDPSLKSNFSSCSSKVGAAFWANLDEARPTQNYVAALLERGVRVLVYVGKYDWICNHVGNDRFTRKMEWTGQGEFGRAELRDWLVDGEVAGQWRSAKGLTFATVERAGHMVPHDKPKEALELINRWISDEPL